jgi:predicted membrane protein
MAEKKRTINYESLVWKRLLIWALPFAIIFYGLFVIAQSECSRMLFIPMIAITIGTVWLMLLVYLIIKKIYK